MIQFSKFLCEKEKIPGGLAKGKSIQDLADKHKVSIQQIKSQLSKGIKIESEHTTDKKIAKEIAMDHIFEDPKYYDKLSKIENYNFRTVNNTLNLLEYIWNSDRTKDQKIQLILALEQRSMVASKYCNDKKKKKIFEDVSNCFRSFLNEMKKIIEDAPVNNVGAGNIAGIAPGEAPPMRFKHVPTIKVKRNPKEVTFINWRSTGGQVAKGKSA